MKIVGIDLSTSPRKCGVCVLEDDAISCVTHGRGSASDSDWLLEYCSEAQVVAIDVPFGWPKPFADALQRYRIGVALDPDRSRYMYRSTDLWVRNELPDRLPRNATRPRPLSVTADRLGATAMFGTILLNSLCDEGFRLSPRTGDPFPVAIEVYPALSLWAWSLPREGLGGNADSAREARRALLGTLREGLSLSITERWETALVEVDHCFDALVAALTGRAYADGYTFDPPESLDLDVLRLEGWIRVPNCDLREDE